MEFEISRLDHHGVVSGVIKDLGLIAQIDRGSCRQTGEAMTPGKVAPGGASALAPAKTAHQGVSTAAAPRATRSYFTCLPT